MSFFVSCGKGLEYLLVDECVALGAQGAKAAMAGVAVEGTQAEAQRIVMHSRLASRVLWPLHSFPCRDEKALYEGASAIDWPMHVAPTASIAVDAHVSDSGITHSQFAAQRVKDAVVDTIRREFDQRPSVDLKEPDVRLHLVIRKGVAIISVDMGGGPLHRRGWRQHQGEAPLKETLAAAMLMRAGWPQMALQEGSGLLDPMCGSGTILIEGALMAADSAPGLSRYPFGVEPSRWLQFDSKYWKTVVADAEQRRQVGLQRLPSLQFIGEDMDSRALTNARRNAELAELDGVIEWRQRAIDDDTANAPVPAQGVVVCNPPYDARLQADPALYRALGAALQERVPGWTAAILCGSEELGKATGLRANKVYQLFNGAIEASLIVVRDLRPMTARETEAPAALNESAQMVANRLRKNRRKLKSWLARSGVTCYRIYDADLPEYAAAVDVYTQADDGSLWLHVQEYAAPATIPEPLQKQRLRDLLSAVREVFEVSRDRVSVKTRSRGKGGSKYGVMDRRGEFLEVREGSALLRVNLFDYLDTGLFLDHRPVRSGIAGAADDKDMLNLFAYTGAATVQAAVGGARSTTSVDLSATYLQWAADNLRINGCTGRAHRLVQADALRFLTEDKSQYDLIFCDPPTFSNSKRAGDFDIQTSHVELLELAMRRLRSDGVLLFSNNFRRFKLDAEAVALFAECEEITAETLDPDFERNHRIHRCWRLTHRN